MTESLRVSAEFYAFLEAHNRDGETMEDTLRRLVGGPRPDDLAGVLSSDTAEGVRDRLAARGEADVDAKRELRKRFE